MAFHDKKNPNLFLQPSLIWLLSFSLPLSHCYLFVNCLLSIPHPLQSLLLFVAQNIPIPDFCLTGSFFCGWFECNLDKSLLIISGNSVLSLPTWIAVLYYTLEFSLSEIILLVYVFIVCYSAQNRDFVYYYISVTLESAWNIVINQKIFFK